MQNCRASLLVGFGVLVVSAPVSLLAQKTIINRPEFGNYLALWRPLDAEVISSERS